MGRYLGAKSTFHHWSAQRSRSFDVRFENRLFSEAGDSTVLLEATIMNYIVKLSSRITKVEAAALKVLVASVLVLMVINVASRH